MTVSKGRVLVVDDEVPLLSVLTEMLSEQGYTVMGVSSPHEALEALSEGEFDLLLTDLVMPGMDGIALIREATEKDPRLVSIVMTGQGDIQSAVAAMKAGALDYITKPFKLSALLPALERGLDVRHLRVNNSQLCETLAIHELARVLAFTADLNAILGKIVDVAMEQTLADEASIMIPCSDGRELRIAAVRGAKRDWLLDQRVPAVSGVAGWVMQHREPLILDGIVTEQAFHPLYPRSDIRSAISIPLLMGGENRGSP